MVWWGLCKGDAKGGGIHMYVMHVCTHNLFETDQWVEMIQVNECGLRESSE